MSLLLKNCLIVDPKSALNNERSNLLIEGGVISSFDSKGKHEEVDLKGKIVTTGWFDLNANFNDPGKEFKEDLVSGSTVAYCGGFTDVQLTSNTDPIIETKSDVEYIKNAISGTVHLWVSGALSEANQGENLTEILDLYSAGVSSISDGDFHIGNSELLLKALQYTSQVDIPVFQCARDNHLSKNTHMHEGPFSTNLGLRGEPSLSEILTIKRDLDILRYAGGRLHFSKISTKEAVDLIRDAKKEGLDVTADVAIHNLLFNDQSIGDFDSIFKVTPPYRSEKDRKALIKGLEEGAIDAICSNHRPQDLESKQLEFDLAEPGSISLQTFYPSLLSLSREISFELLLQRITHGPRSVLGLDEVYIAEGMPAKLTILDPDAKWVLDAKSNKSKSKNSPFWEKELTGKVIGTINGEHYNFLD